MKQFFSFVALAIALTGCVHTENAPSAEVILDHRSDYASAVNGKNLVVPPPLSDYLISHEFDI